MSSRTNVLYVGTANRIKRCATNEQLTNGVVLRIIRALAGIKSSAPLPKTQNVFMRELAKREGDILKDIIKGDSSYAYVIIPKSLADKIDHPHGKTKRHRDICYMVQCVLNDTPAKTNDETFNIETDEEREQMQMITRAKEGNRQRKQQERHESRTKELTPDERAAFDKIWTEHPAVNRGQESKAVAAFKRAIHNGAKIDEIENGHLTWCKSDNWTKNGGQYVTNLPKWLDEGKWKVQPPDMRSDRERQEDAIYTHCYMPHLEIV